MTNLRQNWSYSGSGNKPERLEKRTELANLLDSMVAPEKSISDQSMAIDADVPDTGRSSNQMLGEQPDLITQDSNSVHIKGRADGVSIEIGQGNWPDLMAELMNRLRQASGFFRGGQVTLGVGARPIQQRELHQVRSIVEQFGMSLAVVKSTSEETCHIAMANGLAVSMDTDDGVNAQQALSNTGSSGHFVYRGNIRSGQILHRAETLLILGDVNPGSEVSSQGDILIWGRLRGIVHAGVSGDVHAVVAALSMTPTQIRIADLTAILLEEKPRIGRWFSGQSKSRRPEIAFIEDGQIVVETWDESKPGGIMAFKR
ncbi:septum site-determining protein MinC [Chloroflexi bacterium TSY]|nr:septum site-determining protein MinC [Chloroflexi bacterium TSY]